MPGGFAAPEEARLSESDLLPDALRPALRSWWLAVEHPLANSPNWDIASTALIDDREGIVLVEAKAHANEIKSDSKPVLAKTNWDNHARIDACCRQASVALDDVLPGWSLSAQSHYQLCNRFAFAWKLASLGKPVVLVYLGFLNADEMSDQGLPLKNADDWESLVRKHGRGVVPDEAWDTPIRVSEVFVRAIIQSMTVNLDGTITEKHLR